MEQVGSHWTGFYEISYFSIFRKTVEKTEVALKSDKNSGTVHGDFTRIAVLYIETLQE